MQSKDKTIMEKINSNCRKASASGEGKRKMERCGSLSSQPPSSLPLPLSGYESQSTFGKTEMDLECIMLSKINWTEKDKYCLLSLICGI